jgi:hypothetical protein
MTSRNGLKSSGELAAAVPSAELQVCQTDALADKSVPDGLEGLVPLATGRKVR